MSEIAALIKEGKLGTRGLETDAELDALISLVRDGNMEASKALVEVINRKENSKDKALKTQHVCHALTDPQKGCLEVLLKRGLDGEIELHNEIKRADIELGEMIGKGKAGKVYEGTYKGLKVAIKMFNNPEKLDDKEFRKELSIMSIVREPRLLLPCYGGSSKKGNKFIVTELMETSVYDVIHDDSVDVTEHLRLMMARQIATSMDYLHSRNIIHRDLKSLNLLINKFFEIKICDFGLSRVIDKNQPMTSNIGTVAWIAPEIFSNKKNYSEKADVYSFAVIMWELLTRQMPFGEAEAFTIPVLVTKGKRPTLPKKASKNYLKLLEKCWNQKPEKRPSFAQAVEKLDEMWAELLSKNDPWNRKIAYRLGKNGDRIEIAEISGSELDAWPTNAIWGPLG